MMLNFCCSGGQALEQFTELQEGRYISPPIKVHTSIYTAQSCAELCLKLDHCVSFNYDYGPSTRCELLRSIRHYDENLAVVCITCCCQCKIELCLLNRFRNLDFTIAKQRVNIHYSTFSKVKPSYISLFKTCFIRAFIF